MRGVAGRLRRVLGRRLTGLGSYRSVLRRRGRRLAVDGLVVCLLLAVIAVVVVGAGYAVVYAANAGGTFGVVLGWTGAFAVAVSVPVVAMKLSSALYDRLGV